VATTASNGGRNRLNFMCVALHDKLGGKGYSGGQFIGDLRMAESD